MKPKKIQDRADYPCRYCREACVGSTCERWRECFKRSWQETTIIIKEAVKE